MNFINKLKTVEFFFLLILVFSLPILESIKTISGIIFFLIFLIRLISTKKISRLNSFDIIEKAVLIIVISAFISTIINLPFKNGFSGFFNTFFYSLAFWCIYRNQISKKESHLIAFFIALGVLIGLIYGIYMVMIGKKEYLELKSVGVVTHSSIYLAMTATMVFGLFIETIKTSSKKQSFFWGGSFIFMVICLFIMASRGAILAFIFSMAIIFISLFKRGDLKKISPILISIFIFTLMIFLTVYIVFPNKFHQKRIVDKIKYNLTYKDIDASDSLRFFLWKLAVKQFIQEDKKLFGIGPKNFESVEISKLQLDSPVAGKMKKLTHAHNLFLNKLVEEGIFGLFSILFFFSVLIYRLVRRNMENAHLQWQWFAAVGSIVISVIAGFFNTPWYNEHAILGMIFFALYCNKNKTSKFDDEDVEQA